MNWIQSAENVRLMKTIVAKMSLKHAEIVQLLFNINVIRLMHLTLYVDNAYKMRLIVFLIKMKRAMNVIQFNRSFQILLINVIRLMNWIQYAENVRSTKKIATKMSLKLAEIAHLHFNISVIKQMSLTLFADNAAMMKKIVLLTKMKHVMNVIQFNQKFLK